MTRSHDYVWLELKRNRGYPWPEDSYGLDPMFGPDGWCHTCGVPLTEQRGSLVMQRRASSNYDGAWVPNWRFDEYCIDEPLTDAVKDKFRLDLMPVGWRGPVRPPGRARSLRHRSGLAGLTKRRCADGPARATVRARAARRAGRGAGTRSPIAQLRPVILEARPELSVSASPQWFGDGLQALAQWSAFSQSLNGRTPTGAEVLAEAWRIDRLHGSRMVAMK